MRSVVVFVFILTGFAISFGQISLSPSSVFIDSQTKMASMRLQNRSAAPKEITVTFRYGYVDYNDNGNAYIKYDDSLTAGHYSLNGFIKVIPPKLFLGPGEETILNYRVVEPPGLEEGTYFTRVVVETSNPKAVLGDSSKKESGIDINMKMVGAVIYMKGNLSTSLDITGIEHIADDSILNISVKLNRCKGNSPFFGAIDAVVYDEQGEVIDSLTDTYCTVYFQGKINFMFDRSKFKPGKYIAEITANTDRDDIPKKYIIPVESIHRRYYFEIPR